MDVTDRMRAEEAQRFLAEAGAALASSLDYEDRLSAAVARLVVPRLADWCSVYVTDPAAGCGSSRSPTPTRPRSSGPREWAAGTRPTRTTPRGRRPA